MTDFDDFHNRIPKRLIAATFAASLLFDLIPFPAALSFWLPEMTALSIGDLTVRNRSACLPHSSAAYFWIPASPYHSDNMRWPMS